MAIFRGPIFGAGKSEIMPSGANNGNTEKFLGRLKKMFVVYSAAGVPCYRTSDEAEADYRSYCVGGYYVYMA